MSTVLNPAGLEGHQIEYASNSGPGDRESWVGCSCDPGWQGADELSHAAHVAASSKPLTPFEWAQEQLRNLDSVIAYMESTDEAAWRVDTVRSADGTTNCFFGHLFNMGGNDERGSALWNWFEEMWSTTYRIYPINDGDNPDYPQATPKQRVLAYLRALADGTEMSTAESMEACYQFSLAEDEAKRAEAA